MPRFALHELTLYNNKGDWTKGKNPAGNLVGCHPAFGGRLVKGFNWWDMALGLFQEPAHSLRHTAPGAAASCTHLLISLLASTSLSVRARLHESVFPTRITTNTHLRAADLKFSSSCLYQIYSLGEGAGLLSVPLQH